MVKEMFLSDNRTGCRFITVDAYIKSTGFYQKNEFEFYHSSDDDKNTRIMFFDLIKYEKALEQKCTHSHS
ncbi:MAG: hypothetical protein KAI72_05830 [Candidatus Pacebacteria bacterium]|nr:hypothetical protein [Candidatus Paceibacterota bacterium]